MATATSPIQLHHWRAEKTGATAARLTTYWQTKPISGPPVMTAQVIDIDLTDVPDIYVALQAQQDAAEALFEGGDYMLAVPAPPDGFVRFGWPEETP